MDIRKLIKEELESFFNGGSGIQGVEIVKYLNDLPETRDEVNWTSPRTLYTIPSLENSNGHTEAYDKEFFTGWDRPYARQGKLIPHRGIGYVAEFERMFGEKPLFRINERNIEILNPKFIYWKTKDAKNSSPYMSSDTMGSLD